MYRRVFPRRQIFIDDLTDKIGWAGFSLTHFTVPQCKALHITAYDPTSHVWKQPFVSRKMRRVAPSARSAPPWGETE
jgi:hypothetical protein